jgi:hypothetical protein
LGVAETTSSTQARSDAVPERLLSELCADPQNAAETFALYAVRRIGPKAGADVARFAGQDSGVGDRLLTANALRLTSIHGAVAGTPLFLGLVPAYIAMLWEQARMVLRIAALHGHDPAGMRAAAELLVLRGVHPTLQSAEAAVGRHLAGERSRLPRRRALIDLVRALLVLGGFMEARELSKTRGRLKSAAMMLLGAVIWAITWIAPFTFILLMSWSCRTATMKLASRALSYYGSDLELDDLFVPRKWWSSGARLAASLLPCVLPAAVLFSAVKWHPLGIGFGRALAALAALALVLALFGWGSRFWSASGGGRTSP